MAELKHDLGLDKGNGEEIGHTHRILLKVGDFGLAIKQGNWNGEDGDKCYLAPEVLKHKFKPSPNVVGTAADIFSLGATMLEMLLDQDLPRGNFGSPFFVYSLFSLFVSLHIEGDKWKDLREGRFPAIEDRFV
jgi:serine/threonine protein kinase